MTITSYGKPVAELGPVGQMVRDAATRERRRNGLAELREHWSQISPVVVGPWRRDEFYEDSPPGDGSSS